MSSVNYLVPIWDCLNCGKTFVRGSMCKCGQKHIDNLKRQLTESRKCN